MGGIRIHHGELRNCVLLVPHPGDPRTGRRPKDYRITLDGDGDCIVSETVWRRLEEARGSGLSPHAFIILNEVADPPAIRLGAPGETAGNAGKVRTYRQTPDGVTDEELLSIAQQVAKGGPARVNSGGRP